MAGRWAVAAALLALGGAAWLALGRPQAEAPARPGRAAPAPAAGEGAAVAPPLPEPRPFPATPRAARASAEPQPDREAIESFLRAALDAHLPEIRLSSEEIAEAADALARLRRARQELGELEPGAENAERRRALTEQLGRAVDDFRYVLEMSPAEFTARVQPGVGIDRGDAGPEEPSPPGEPEYLEGAPSGD